VAVKAKKSKAKGGLKFKTKKEAKEHSKLLKSEGHCAHSELKIGGLCKSKGSKSVHPHPAF